MVAPRKAARSGQQGFTLVEVLVSLWIVAFATVGGLTVVGMAKDDVLNTERLRKMRYLIQNILGDVEVGKRVPDDPEEPEPYEEGMSGDFGFLLDAEDYDRFRWNIPVFRDEVICGAADEETLTEAGFVSDMDGNLVGRPVTNDYLEEQEGEESTEPPGQIKRVLVFTVSFVGEDMEDDQEYSIMTFLPFPGEEEQQLGGPAGGEPGAPGGPGGPGGQEGQTSSSSAGGADGATRGRSGSSDK